MSEPITSLPAAVAALGALPMPVGPARPIADLDTPLSVLERQLAEIHARAIAHLKERGQTPTAEHWAQWRAFLDIDPDLRGRDYSRKVTP